MRRWLRVAVYSGALLVGLAVAVGLQGRVHHLRVLIPGALQGWTEALRPDAGLRAGRMTVGEGLAVLDWQAGLPGRAGPVWRLKLNGQGADLTATLTADWRMQRFSLADLAGTVDLGGLPDGPWRALGGRLVPRPSEVVLDRRQSPPQWTVVGAADWQDASFDGVALGGGPVALRLDPLGSWRLTAALAGGVSDIAAVAVGRLPSRTVGLVLDVADAPDVPATWRNALRLTGVQTGTGWQVEQRVDLP